MVLLLTSLSGQEGKDVQKNSGVSKWGRIRKFHPGGVLKPGYIGCLSGITRWSPPGFPTADMNGNSTLAGFTASTENTGCSLISFAAPFGPGINQGDSTQLTIALSNSNPILLRGQSFSDTLPPGVLIQTPNGHTGGCGAGAIITATPGTNGISLSGRTVGPSGTCTFSVDVTGIAEGPQDNVTTTVTMRLLLAGRLPHRCMSTRGGCSFFY